MSRIQDEKGFTLVELMLAIILSSIVAGAIFLALRTGEDQTRTGDLKMTIQESAREALYKMSQEIRQSAPDRITIGVGNNTIQFQVPNPSNPVDSNYDIDWSNAHTIGYGIGGSGQQLMRTNSTMGTLSVLANDVVGVNFSGNDTAPTVVTLTLSMQRTLLNGRTVPTQPLQVTAEAEVRNVSSS